MIAHNLQTCPTCNGSGMIDRRLIIRPKIVDEIIDIACDRFTCSRRDFTMRRTERVVLARRLAIKALAARKFTLAQIGLYVNLGQKAVIKNLKGA